MTFYVEKHAARSTVVAGTEPGGWKTVIGYELISFHPSFIPELDVKIPE